ncbi:MAG: hypothetical protein HKP24_02820 [Croceitalea sp.]|nr:hypothetical protein [Croceitalea sp.]NNM17479.1 hypothetical protein [Croceitalea sp.]
MKKVLFFMLILLAFACSDGELQIETLDFDSASIDFCTDPVATSSNIFFKINGDEALILELPSGVLNNGVVGADTITTQSTIPSQAQLTYRIFSNTVTSTYFCSDIPPASPTVTEEIEAEDGLVIIKTIANADTTAYNHTIELSNITLINGIGERITDLSINEYGEVTTAISN